MKEICYVESEPGLFEPAPTRSQIRKAKRELEAQKKRRKERWEMVAGVVGIAIVIAAYAIIFAVWIFASAIWPMK